MARLQSSAERSGQSVEAGLHGFDFFLRDAWSALTVLSLSIALIRSAFSVLPFSCWRTCGGVDETAQPTAWPVRGGRRRAWSLLRLCSASA